MASNSKDKSNETVMMFPEQAVLRERMATAKREKFARTEKRRRLRASLPQQFIRKPKNQALLQLKDESQLHFASGMLPALQVLGNIDCDWGVRRVGVCSGPPKNCMGSATHLQTRSPLESYCREIRWELVKSPEHVPGDKFESEYQDLGCLLGKDDDAVFFLESPE